MQSTSSFIGYVNMQEMQIDKDEKLQATMATC